MRITKLLAQLGATKKNIGWSWGAVDERERRVYLQIWDHQFAENERYVQVDWDGSDKLGAKERKSHFDLIRQGYTPYGIRCKVMDENTRPRVIAGVDHEKLLRLGEFKRIGSKTFMEVIGEVPSIREAESDFQSPNWKRSRQTTSGRQSKTFAEVPRSPDSAHQLTTI